MDKGNQPSAPAKRSPMPWFAVGILVGMLVFPWVAEMPFRQSWQSVGRHGARLLYDATGFAAKHLENTRRSLGAFQGPPSVERETQATFGNASIMKEEQVMAKKPLTYGE